MAASVLMAFTFRRSKPVAKSQVKEHLFQQRASLQSLLQSKGPGGNVSSWSLLSCIYPIPSNNYLRLPGARRCVALKQLH